MIDFGKLRALQIKKEIISLTLIEKEELKNKTYVYMGIFILAFLIMGILQTARSNSQITEMEFNAGKAILRFGGMFLWIGIFLIFRVFSLKKEIKSLEKEYKELNQEIFHLSN
jgi:preprotein translocase subunit SecG